MSNPTDETQSPQDLQKALRSKDQIIAALTEQLEGTVEQLDRLQRAGVKPGGRSGGGGFGGLGLAAQVEAALEAYEELSPAERFDRIEAGIEEILDAISKGSVGSTSSPRSTAPQPPAPKKTAADDDDYWEATKARLMGQAASESPTQPPKPDPSASTSAATDFDSESDSSDHHEQDDDAPSQFEYQQRKAPPPLPKPPKPVTDLKNAILLEEAVTERDSFISYLIGRLRTAESAHYPPIDWKELNQAPQELQEQLKLLEKQLADQLRQAEVAVALERAALTRERSKLFQVKQHLAEEVKKISVASATAQTRNSEEARESRLGRFLPIKK